MKIDRDLVLNRCWELACLDVEKTKGSITGQLKALELLLQALAAKPESPAKTVQIYRSAWMDLPTPDQEM